MPEPARLRRAGHAVLWRLQNGISPDELRHFWDNHGTTVTVGAIVAAGAALRFATLGNQSLDHDETVTAARVIHPDFFRSMQVVVDGERSPPLYYALAWLWSRFFGVGAVGLRSLSAIFGTLTVLAAYLSGRELASRRAGIAAACLVALNPYLIWYSQEARSYGALIAFGAFGLYFFARALRRPSRGAHAGWAAMSALALCSHYFAIFAILPEAAVLLMVRERRRSALGACLAIAAVGLALLPLAIIQEGGGRGNGFTQFPVIQRAETALVKYTTLEGPAPQAGILSTTPVQREVGTVGVAFLVLAGGVAAARGMPSERRGAARAGIVAAAAFGTPVALALGGFDYVDPRNMVGALVPALVAAGVGFGSARVRALGPAALVASLALFLYVLRVVATEPYAQRHDWRAMAKVLPTHQVPRLYVVPTDGRTPIDYYTGRNLAKFEPKRFPDGIATRSVVVISDSPSITGPGSGFDHVGTRTAPQHWTIKLYAAHSPIAIDPARVPRMMLQPSTGLVACGHALVLAEAATDLPSG